MVTEEHRRRSLFLAMATGPSTKQFYLLSAALDHFILYRHVSIVALSVGVPYCTVRGMNTVRELYL